jgi:hypothetical protein
MALSNRAQLYHPVVDEAGDLFRYARIRVYLEDGVTPFDGQIYRDGTSTKTYGNPFVAAPALVTVYFERPTRVRLGMQVDLSKPEVIGDVIDVTLDADHAVDTLSPLYIQGDWVPQGLLCGRDSATAFWKPLRIDHEHAAVASGTTLAGSSSLPLRQAGTFDGATVLGAGSGGWGAHSSLRSSSMLGSLADGYGRGTTAIGHNALAEEADATPWRDGATALGRAASAIDGAVAVGAQTVADDGSVSLGAGTWAGLDSAVALGTGARPAGGGLAIGANAGSSANGMPGSIGLGTGAQYGLPSSTDAGDTSVLLGGYDPSRARIFPWANPGASQSESPFNEFTPTMAFTGRTVQLQRHLEWLADIVGLQVSGDVTLGGPDGLLGFYGTAPKVKASLGDDEPSSGITALDNLIYALRDLGLLRYRTEASMLYRGDDLTRHYRDGDQVAAWPEHFGGDTARAVPGRPPTYRLADAGFNRQPTVGFNNSIYLRSTQPIGELRGANLLPQEKHYIAVASHTRHSFGLNEGLLNLSYLDRTVTDDTNVLAGDGYDTGRWQARNISAYTADGLDQTRNMDARLPGPHAYAVSHPATWPHARPVIGGPRDNATSDWNRWSGNIAELVGMDATWEPRHVASMATGLQFKYDINQPDSALKDPAKNFVLTQHDPMNGTLIFWDKDYSDGYLGKVRGHVIRVPKSVIFVPFISIYIAFSYYFFRGSLVGNWGNISGSSEYEVDISIKIGDLDEDGDIDVDVEFDVETESHVGTFSLNNNLTWSMGQLNCDYGYKICRIRHRITREIVCISGEPPFRYADTDVLIYSTKSDGSLLLEATTPLWGDGSFKAWVRHPGKKIARVVERSTGNVLGTTEYQEKALPRTQLYADDDPEVSFANRDKANPYESALTTFSILEMSPLYWYRARHILATLRLVCNDDGSLNESYSAVLPVKATRPAGESPERWGAAWAILAVLRYQAVTGDGQFLAFATQLADFLAGSTMATSTRTRAATYFAYRDLAAVTGTTSYATAAQNVRTALLADCWVASPGRWKEASDADAESLHATVMGGLFALAIGDQAKARASIRHLKRFRVKNAGVSAPHYAGPTGLLGYKTYADAGSAPHTSPPAVIDQEGTWLGVLFKMRYGEPIGDDVVSLYRWGQNSISADPTHDLYSPQFLRYSGNATTAPYNLRARPHLAVGSWGHILANGGRALLVPDPLPAPVPTEMGLSVAFDSASGRYQFRYTWKADPSVPAVAYEAVAEQSTDSEVTWSAASSGSVQGQLGGAADLSVGTNGFSATWSTPPPDNAGTRYRVRVRLRNAAFGSWVATPSTGLPTAS